MLERCVLVADDDPDQRDGIAEVLEINGYRVATAANGFQALEIAATISPAAILLDLGMPVMTGWEVMDALARDGTLRDIPIIVISGDLDLPGHVAVIPKPFRIEALLTCLERVLAGGASERAALPHLPRRPRAGARR